ncbi:hypothetical protein B1207_05115 [Legionella quinlivanii]|uniref:Uncharacterized protein n=1 Tax=Legionella quinlivanii TaxID=45073 RepID=A0A364LLE8_9GAMM|nr:hypothetical protein B1207_05115 [Legionella quinlivanii]
MAFFLNLGRGLEIVNYAEANSPGYPENDEIPRCARDDVELRRKKSRIFVISLTKMNGINTLNFYSKFQHLWPLIFLTPSQGSRKQNAPLTPGL